MRAETFLIFTVPLAYLALAPYTKVEESFNLQAAHDILTFGIGPEGLEKYDHMEFPGVVPRTFLGAAILAMLASPTKLLDLDPFAYQYIVRGILSILTSLALYHFYAVAGRTLGRSTAFWYALLQATQFHVNFYASRTLPNTFAFILSKSSTTFYLQHWLTVCVIATIAQSFLLQNRIPLALALLTFTTTIFRIELLLLLATTTLHLLLTRRMTIPIIIKSGFIGGISGLLVTVGVDSWFWGEAPMWPEAVGFWYNAVLGKSVEWGTSPWWTYFLESLPKLSLNPLTYVVLVPLAVAWHPRRRVAWDLVVPNLAFVAVYSVQPHKEWRFIEYVVPPLTLTAAMGASYIWDRRSKHVMYKLGSIAAALSVPFTLALALLMGLISSLNYPGGHALARLHSLSHSTSSASRMWMDVATCMTGASRFGQKEAEGWWYDKTEDEQRLLEEGFWEGVDWIITEDVGKFEGAEWEKVEAVRGYAGVGILRDVGGIEEKGGSEVPRMGWWERWATLWPAPYGVRLVERIWILRKN
ncbi:Dol-P-Man:Man(7)GlcNAc(2)-PP-Dol alpha-1,6-mannosyltransferase [Saitoella coloradoensis]